MIRGEDFLYPIEEFSLKKCLRLRPVRVSLHHYPDPPFRALCSGRKFDNPDFIANFVSVHILTLEK